MDSPVPDLQAARDRAWFASDLCRKIGGVRRHIELSQPNSDKSLQRYRCLYRSGLIAPERQADLRKRHVKIKSGGKLPDNMRARLTGGWEDANRPSKKRKPECGPSRLMIDRPQSPWQRNSILRLATSGSDWHQKKPFRSALLAVRCPPNQSLQRDVGARSDLAIGWPLLQRHDGSSPSEYGQYC